jgi:hypothetical protein
MTKRCCTCRESFPLSEFGKDKQRRDGMSIRCRACNRSKSSGWYRKNSERAKEAARAWGLANREMVNARQRAWRAENPEKTRANKSRWAIRNPERARLVSRKAHLKCKYGISIEIYEQMLKDCGGVCQICGNPPKNRPLAIDHDHQTGAIRGLLCNGCNAALGRFGDDIPGLQAAIRYLERATSAEVAA